jgi:hypothetical protein
MREREARLRPEYQERYPDITSGVWHNAAWVTEKVLQHSPESPAALSPDRPLPDAHFEFQGGITASAPWYDLPRRRTDRTVF